MFGFVVRATLAVSLLFAADLGGITEGSGQNEAGQFDFYVLSLSWSPSFCAAAAERGNDRGPTLQCGERPYWLVMHGLWPQYEKGFPKVARSHRRDSNRDIVSSMLDLMQARHLILQRVGQARHMFRASAAGLFDFVRKARAVVKIPGEYTELQESLSVTPGGVEDAFIKANPGLSSAGMAVECDKKRLTEVRICLSKELQFRDCAGDRTADLPARGIADAATAGR